MKRWVVISGLLLLLPSARGLDEGVCVVAAVIVGVALPVYDTADGGSIADWGDHADEAED